MPSFSDVFQQITGGNVAKGSYIQPNRQAQYQSITSQFQPGKYASINAGIAVKNPSSYNDVPSLNAGLKAGYINQNQWNQQFKVIQSKLPSNKPIGGYTLKDALNNATQQGENIALAAPRAAISTAKQIGKQASYLSGPTSTQPQRSTIIANQTAAAANPAYTAATKGINPGVNSAAGLIQAQKMAASGAKAPQIKSFLQQDAQALNRQTMTGASNAAVLASMNVAGGGLGSKLLGVAKTAAGKDEAVNGLISAVKTAQATNLANKADRIGSSVVKEAKTTRVPVTGESTAAVGRTATIDAAAYTKQSAQLSKNYDKEIAALKNQPPIRQQFLQKTIDAKYQGLQNTLDQSAGKTTIDFANSKPLPHSALTPPQTAEPKATPINEGSVAGKGSGKTTPVTTPVKAEVKPTTPIIPGEKTSGSALRTEQKAVESGLQGELQGKADYSTVSHKQEAAKAVQLLHENPQKAEDIAMGRTAGNNASHEAAVYHAVANDALQQAKKTGDYSKVTALASSPRHTAVSEAAQKLGAEGYNVAKHDPIQIMNDVAKSRQAALGRKAGVTVEKETVNISKEVKQAMPKVSRQDWHNFVESLKC